MISSKLFRSRCDELLKDMEGHDPGNEARLLKWRFILERAELLQASKGLAAGDKILTEITDTPLELTASLGILIKDAIQKDVGVYKPLFIFNSLFLKAVPNTTGTAAAPESQTPDTPITYRITGTPEREFTGHRTWYRLDRSRMHVSDADLTFLIHMVYQLTQDELDYPFKESNLYNTFIREYIDKVGSRTSASYIDGKVILTRSRRGRNAYSQEIVRILERNPLEAFDSIDVINPRLTHTRKSAFEYEPLVVTKRRTQF